MIIEIMCHSLEKRGNIGRASRYDVNSVKRRDSASHSFLHICKKRVVEKKAMCVNTFFERQAIFLNQMQKHGYVKILPIILSP